MESEQNDNKEYVVVYDLCDTAGKVLQRMPKDDILKLSVITEKSAKEKFDYNKLNAKEVNDKKQEYYYIDLYNKKLFAKVPSNKCSYDYGYGFTVETDKQKTDNAKMSYNIGTGKDFVENSENIDGVLLKKSGPGGQLFFNKEDRRFSYYTSASIDNGLEYQISLEKFLSDNNPSFNLFRSSYCENLFHPVEHEYMSNKAGSFARLFGVANDGNNRCGVGCFSCGKVMVNNDYYDIYDKYHTNFQERYYTKLSLDDVSRRIGINSE